MFPVFRQYLPTCVLLALILCGLDGVGQFFVPGADSSVGAWDMWKMACATFVLYLVVSVVFWAISWLLTVVLGGGRPGTAFFGVVVYLVFLTLAMAYVEIWHYDFIAENWDTQPLLVLGLAIFSVVVALLITLPVARLTARHATFRIPAIFALGTAVVLLEAVVLLWLFVNTFGASAYLALLLLLPLAALSIYLVRRSVIRGFPYRAVLTLCLVALLLPAPWTLTRLRAVHSPADFTKSDHMVPRVLLITVDTLRRDALTTYNPTGGLTENMDRIGRDGTIFDNAYSASSWTLPSVASIMTGLPPRTHGATDWAAILPTEFDTIAEHLSDAGYRTAAMGDNFFLAPRGNMSQGFHYYRWYPTPWIQAQAFRAGFAHWLWTLPLLGLTSTESLSDNAITWVKEHADEDFFFWLHLYDPHVPFTPPEEYMPGGTYPERGSGFWAVPRVRIGHTARTAEERAWIRSLYDAEVRYVDHHIGELLDTLENLGIYDDTLIILTSDHGEEFWDHDGFEHGHTLYNELIHVPLMVKLPGGGAGARVATNVSTQALLPTITELTGLDVAAPDPNTPSFAPLAKDPDAYYPDHPIASGAILYYSDMDSVIQGNEKFIEDHVTGRERLFNLESDPGEHNSLLESHPSETGAGRAALDALTEHGNALRESFGGDATLEHDISDQDKEALRSIGYL